MSLLRAYTLLVLGVAGVSTAALWVRLAGDAATLEGGLAGELAFRRLALSLPLLWLWGRLRKERALPGAGEWGRIITSGLFLAAHFHLWTVSLAYMPTATSLILVSTHPVMVMTIEVARRRYPGRTLGFVGMALALGGTYLLARHDAATLGDDYLLGVGAALGAAAAMTGYLLAGRSLRKTTPVSTYVLGCYAVAALALGVYQLAWAGGNLLPADARGWELSILLAVFPTVLGHTPLNAALSRVPATVVSTSFLGEVVGASLLVWIVIGERVPPGFFTGGSLVAVGILAVTLAGAVRRRPRGGIPEAS